MFDCPVCAARAEGKSVELPASEWMHHEVHLLSDVEDKLEALGHVLARIADTLDELTARTPSSRGPGTSDRP